MNRIRANKLLGIALGDKRMLVAEVQADAGSGAPGVVKSAEFAYPDGIAMDNPVELGKGLAAFLRENGFRHHTAVIGLPAKWVLSLRKELPPVNAEAAAGMLRLAAEGDFSSEAERLTIDYIGDPDTASACTALLVATSRQRIEQCQTLARAARLRLEAVTITGASFAVIDGSRSDRSLILSLAPIGNELVIHQGGVPTHLRHLAMTNGQATDPASVVTELRRVVGGLGDEKVSSLLVCADQPLGRAVEEAVRSKLPVVPRIHAGNRAFQDQFAPAAAVAIAALTARKPGVDFLHSRLAPPAVGPNRRPLIWGIAIACTLFLVVVAGWYDLFSAGRQLDGIRTHLKAIETDVKTAQVDSNRLETAQAWMSGKPRYLACMRDLTAIFPEEGSTYATTLTLRSDLSGQVSGRAPSEQRALQLLDQIVKDSKHFKNVKLGEVRDAGRNSREIAFTISFTYQPE